jgi:hypothetical protein
MKKLFTIILILASISLKSQTTDSLSYLFEQQRNLEQDLKSFNKQYKSGTIMIGIGAGFSVLGGIATISSKETSFQGIFLFGAGGLFCLFGTITQIDSHKYLGGKVSLTRGGIKIDLN